MAPRDFSELLHELRERELRRLPAGAATVLHGGAAGSWYFRWFDEHYPGEVERHVAVEYFQERPDDLPDNVEWLARTLGDMGPVADGSVDMVFGGQVIEHLWPHDVAGLLLESRRVLRPGGHLVLDSPNRRVTQAIGWQHPQHTVEFSVDEACGLVRLAGFEVEEVRGVLLGYDASGRAFLGIDDLEAEAIGWEDRARLAADRPEDAFIWWLVARRSDREPDGAAVARRAHECFEAFRATRLRALQTPLEAVHETGEAPVVARSDAGPLFHGPYMPVDGGRWRVAFELRAPAASGAEPLGYVDVTSDAGRLGHARRDVTIGDLRPGAWTEVALEFDLPEMTMGVEFRAVASGAGRLEARLGVRLERAGTVARPVDPPPPPEPELRVRELAARIAGRTAEGLRHRARTVTGR